MPNQPLGKHVAQPTENAIERELTAIYRWNMQGVYVITFGRHS